MSVVSFLGDITLGRVRSVSVPRDDVAFVPEAYRFLRDSSSVIYSPQLDEFILLAGEGDTKSICFPELIAIAPKLGLYEILMKEEHGKMLCAGRDILILSALGDHLGIHDKDYDSGLLDRVFYDYGQFVEAMSSRHGTVHDCLWPLHQAVEKLAKFCFIKRENFSGKKGVGHNLSSIPSLISTHVMRQADTEDDFPEEYDYAGYAEFDGTYLHVLWKNAICPLLTAFKISPIEHVAITDLRYRQIRGDSNALKNLSVLYMLLIIYAQEIERAAVCPALSMVTDALINGYFARIASDDAFNLFKQMAGRRIIRFPTQKRYQEPSMVCASTAVIPLG